MPVLLFKTLVMTNEQKIEFINNNINAYALYWAIGTLKPEICKIASKVHPETGIVGIDLLDSCPLPLLAELSEIIPLTHDNINDLRQSIELHDLDIHTKGRCLTDKEVIKCYIKYCDINIFKPAN